jgi:hypothetical protein
LQAPIHFVFNRRSSAFTVRAFRIGGQKTFSSPSVIGGPTVHQAAGIHARTRQASSGASVILNDMSVNEELGEQAEHAKEPFERNVAVSMAIIAAGLAIVTVLGHIYANEELLAQQRASDQWAYYQAKSSRRYESDIARDILQQINTQQSKAQQSDAGATAKAVEKYTANQERYEKEGQEVQTEARKLEAESKINGQRALRMHTGEVFLEVGIVFASLAILTKRRSAWSAAILSACVGSGIALTTILLK